MTAFTSLDSLPSRNGSPSGRWTTTRPSRWSRARRSLQPIPPPSRRSWTNAHQTLTASTASTRRSGRCRPTKLEDLSVDFVPFASGAESLNFPPNRSIPVPNQSNSVRSKWLARFQFLSICRFVLLASNRCRIVPPSVTFT